MAETSSAPGLSPAGFNEYNTALQGAALQATKSAVQLPSDISFHRSVDRTFGRDIEACSSRVLSLANRLLDLAATADTSSSSRGKGKARLETEDDVVDNFHALVVDSMDQLLERADICLDESLGRLKPPAITVNPVQKSKKTSASQGRLDPSLQHASHIPKPQLSFQRKADNSSHTIWQPTLRHKYNAQVPLGYNLREDDSEDNLSGTLPLHPYRYEIRHISYPPRMFMSSPPISPRPFSETPFTWVTDSDSFAAMLEKLRKAREIAVDLEHHSYRTFSGFVCLMQLSTRDEDWVVDTLAIREELEALNEVFTDPDIVKVLHGAESDIVWLQQDFNLYIVNLFDTYHASKVLDFPRHSLATLLEMYCDFTADKRYQLADWRIRPLPEEMLTYARSDTHFLLYIYDNLRNALLDRAQSSPQTPTNSRPPSPSASQSTHALVREVLSRSEETALHVYEKRIYDAEGGSGFGGWNTLARKWNKGALMAGSTTSGVYAVQRAVYRCVHAWRDRVAREEDESTRYVLPDHYLFVLAERPPADMAALLSIFRPVPQVIRRRSKELFDAIQDAIKQERGKSDSHPTADVIIPSQSVQVADVPVAGASTSVVDAVRAEETAEPGSSSASGSKLTSLWSHVSRPSAAASSALFGASLVTKVDIKEVTSYAASRSALFGERNSMSTSKLEVPSQKDRFREVVDRIHASLVIAPSAPIVQPAVMSTSESSSVTPARDVPAVNLTLTDAVEIPFVPAAQRQQAPTEIIDDSIVVVGQARQKKRKRAHKGALQKGKDGTDSQEAAAEPFDYGAASNILDEGSEPEQEDSGARKKRHKKNKGTAAYHYGDFPAPPKAHSQPKSGNVSRTFRK
ncbi:hypothetical protein WOLCODRAFT_162269 [Wolfiporia cocos MD-104 SS10]|uniref:HRDC domain-containing protein n=1 Tax=Wolfiporia cocos (strain MD-104) TaxID=742152 RepID=A0A2H3JDP4_WOLCO|nr:hypothetical protein WOLCODRAFT_162269 [Wolfiporia cocos MD-104 SS10]